MKKDFFENTANIINALGLSFFCLVMVWLDLAVVYGIIKSIVWVLGYGF